MTTFYRDKAVYVGSAELQVDDRAYRLDDLELVWHQRSRRGGQVLAVILARVLLVVGVIGVIAAAAMAAHRVDLSGYDDLAVLGGAVVGVVLAGMIGLFAVDGVISLIERSYEKGSAEHQIWARHLNADILLFATHDKLTFGKVYRAIQRAIEYRDV